MKILTRIVLGLALLVSTTGFGQGQYKILTKVGDIHITRQATESKIVVGDKLEGEFELILEESAYLGMIDQHGKVIELRTKGTYSNKNLAAIVAEKSSSSLTSKYASYLLNDPGRSLSNQIKATGAVERAIFAENETIALGLPEKSNVFSNEILLAWRGENSKKYEIEVFDLYKQKLASYEVKGTEFKLNLQDANLKDLKTVLIKVQTIDKKEHSKLVALNKISAEERVKHQANLEGILTQNGGALNEFFTATYFLENDLIADAFTYYANASRLEPGVEAYNKVYTEWIN